MNNRSLTSVVAIATLGLASPLSARQAIVYTAEEVAPAIHVFQPNDPGLGNVVAVVSDGEALVVDATGTPDAAQGVLRELRRLGVMRLVAVVNTHWHDDHIWGNQVFADSFPDLNVVAHAATVQGIREQAIPALSGQISRLHERIAERAGQLERGVGPDGAPLDPDTRANLEQRQSLFRDAVMSLETVRPVVPAELGGDSRQYVVGGIDVSVQHLGAGHTRGDLIVRVPARGVLVAGDLITRPVPAAAEADLLSWREVLESMHRMDWAVLVPGHGSPQYDGEYLADVITLFNDLVEYVRRGHEAGRSPDEMVELADFGGFRDRWLGEDPREALMFNAFFIEPGIRSVYASLAEGARVVSGG